MRFPFLAPMLLVPLLVCAAGPARAADGDALEVDLGGGVTMPMVRVPAGRFTQGTGANAALHQEDERAREVEIRRDFYIGRTEVTVGQFKRFVQATGYKTEAEKGASGGFGLEGGKLVQRRAYTWRNPGFAQTDAHPVVLVTYADAVAFTKWASDAAKRPVTLPTEAQFEFAARAKDADAAPAEADGWFKSNAADGTHEAKSAAPNALGLYGMAGNAQEWCLDWYAPYAKGPVSDPCAVEAPASDKPRRVLRGGSFLRDARAGRAAARSRNDPGSRNADNGFRVVMPIQENP